jgi:hypothetical protein
VYAVVERIIRGALGAAFLASLGACSEQVTSSLGCPQLCTDQSGALRDTVLSAAVAVDSTLLGFPILGSSRELSLVSRGDTADVRVVARFDTLPGVYRLPSASADSTIQRVDSATMIFRIDTTFTRPTIPVTIDAFDVDTTAADTVPSTLLPLFRPDRLLGSRTYQPSELVDTLQLPISNTVVLRKITDGSRLRVGLRVRAAQSVTLRLSGSTFAPRIRLRVSPDSTVAPDTIALRSKTPEDDPTIAAALALYPVRAAGALGVPPSVRLAVGGIAGARSYFRFDIPSKVIDSVQIVRATLLLTQVAPRSAGGAGDTLTVLARAVVAGPLVTDVFIQSQLLAPFGSAIDVDTLRIVPGAPGTRELEVVRVVRAWQGLGTTNTLRALVISALQEGSSPGEINFTSIEGPDAQRPRLRLTYVPRRGFGIP